jgi:hypothetical protein
MNIHQINHFSLLGAVRVHVSGNLNDLTIECKYFDCKLDTNDS